MGAAGCCPAPGSGCCVSIVTNRVWCMGAPRAGAVLRDLGVDGQVRELPELAATAATAAAQISCEVGTIANSLILSADGATRPAWRRWSG